MAIVFEAVHMYKPQMNSHCVGDNVMLYSNDVIDGSAYSPYPHLVFSTMTYPCVCVYVCFHMCYKFSIPYDVSTKV